MLPVDLSMFVIRHTLETRLLINWLNPELTY